MWPLSIIIVPVPVGGSNSGWLRRCPPDYPPKPRPAHWPPRQAIPTDDARRAIAQARREIAEARAARLMRELRP
jgi:hypothetical protein